MTTYFESTGARDAETASAYDQDLAAAREAEEAAREAEEASRAAAGSVATATEARAGVDTATGGARGYESAPGYDAAYAAAEKAGRAGPIDAVVERLAERVGGKASVRAVFGDPIERDGMTIIPVARVRWGFGGGGGSGMIPVGPGRPGAMEGQPGTPEGDPGETTAGGAGGGATADPVGYLEIGPDGATFHPISAARPSPAFLLAAGAAAALVLSGLARLLRR